MRMMWRGMDLDLEQVIIDSPTTGIVDVTDVEFNDFYRIAGRKVGGEVELSRNIVGPSTKKWGRERHIRALIVDILLDRI